MGRRQHRLHPPQRLHRRMLRGDARGHRTAAHRKAAERACARLPLQRRRHHAGGGQNPGNVRPQRDRGGQHQGAFGRFEAGVPHRHGADPCRPAADGADQRQFGVVGGDRRRGVAGPRPRGADRPAQFRQGTRAVAPPATTSPRAAASRPSTIPIRRRVRCARCPTR